eukprot:gene4940-893_t
MVPGDDAGGCSLDYPQYVKRATSGKAFETVSVDLREAKSACSWLRLALPEGPAIDPLVGPKVMDKLRPCYAAFSNLFAKGTPGVMAAPSLEIFIMALVGWTVKNPHEKMSAHAPTLQDAVSHATHLQCRFCLHTVSLAYVQGSRRAFSSRRLSGRSRTDKFDPFRDHRWFCPAISTAAPLNLRWIPSGIPGITYHTAYPESRVPGWELALEKLMKQIQPEAVCLDIGSGRKQPPEADGDVPQAQWDRYQASICCALQMLDHSSPQANAKTSATVQAGPRSCIPGSLGAAGSTLLSGQDQLASAGGKEQQAGCIVYKDPVSCASAAPAPCPGSADARILNCTPTNLAVPTQEITECSPSPASVAGSAQPAARASTLPAPSTCSGSAKGCPGTASSAEVLDTSLDDPCQGEHTNTFTISTPSSTFAPSPAKIMCADHPAPNAPLPNPAPEHDGSDEANEHKMLMANATDCGTGSDAAGGLPPESQCLKTSPVSPALTSPVAADAPDNQTVLVSEK